MDGRCRRYDRSLALNQRFHDMVPGACHTYAKGDDQYPGNMLPYIVRGEGSHVWDLDGNEFIEYAPGLRSVTLGHGYRSVVEAACKAMADGTNFNRPSVVEIQAAEAFLDMMPAAEMVKFCKDGSDATTNALRLARAHTGRDMVARCADHPFFAVDDWFIGSTEMNAGIPRAVRDLTVQFRYNDIDNARALFERFPGQIACVILEPEKYEPARDGFLHQLRDLTHAHGAVFILDEMITGFRWHNQGAQHLYDLVPDLTTWGKAMGNGFSVSALSGSRELMEVGGLKHDRERVWLLSATHGAETHGLAAAMEVMRIYREEPVVETLWSRGARLAEGLKQVICRHGLHDYLGVKGRPCCLIFTTAGPDGLPSEEFRTLMLQENMRRGLLAPSLILSYSHTDEDVDRTLDAFDGSLVVYRRALQDGFETYLESRPVQPVYRIHNGVV